MATTSRKNPLFTNPFFAALVVVSVFFVLTILAWLVAAGELDDSDAQALKQADLTFASWLDRNGPLALTIEFVIMLVAGVLAMLTDGWFSGARAPDVRSGTPKEPKSKSMS